MSKNIFNLLLTGLGDLDTELKPCFGCRHPGGDVKNFGRFGRMWLCPKVRILVGRFDLSFPTCPERLPKLWAEARVILPCQHFECEALANVDTASRCKINFWDFSFRTQFEIPPSAGGSHLSSLSLQTVAGSLATNPREKKKNPLKTCLSRESKLLPTKNNFSIVQKRHRSSSIHPHSQFAPRPLGRSKIDSIHGGSKRVKKGQIHLIQA